MSADVVVMVCFDKSNIHFSFSFPLQESHIALMFCSYIKNNSLTFNDVYHADISWLHICTRNLRTFYTLFGPMHSSKFILWNMDARHKALFSNVGSLSWNMVHAQYIHPFPHKYASKVCVWNIWGKIVISNYLQQFERRFLSSLFDGLPLWFNLKTKINE